MGAQYAAPDAFHLQGGRPVTQRSTATPPTPPCLVLSFTTRAAGGGSSDGQLSPAGRTLEIHGRPARCGHRSVVSELAEVRTGVR